jgi:hypothetical protein
LSRTVEAGHLTAACDKLPPKLGRIIDGVFCEASFCVCAAAIANLSVGLKSGQIQDLLPRAASTYSNSLELSD